MTTAIRLPRTAQPRAQRGVSLLFALIALVILAFGSVALTRSVDTGTLIMGNLAFRQDAVSSSSSGAEEAMQWLSGNLTGTTLDSHIPAKGYRASSTDTLDPTGTETSASNTLTVINWDGNCMGLPATAYSTCLEPYRATDVNKNKVQWLITRLCQSADKPPAPPNLCLRPANSGSGSSKDRGELGPGGRPTGTQASPYYRIVVRVDGPRNTVSYTESLVHF